MFILIWVARINKSFCERCSRYAVQQYVGVVIDKFGWIHFNFATFSDMNNLNNPGAPDNFTGMTSYAAAPSVPGTRELGTNPNPSGKDATELKVALEKQVNTLQTQAQTSKNKADQAAQADAQQKQDILKQDKIDLQQAQADVQKAQQRMTDVQQQLQQEQ